MTTSGKLANLAIVIALAIFFSSPLVLLFAGKQNTLRIDNRALAMMPSFSLTALADAGYYRKLKTYLVDRFPYRPAVVRQRGVLLQNYLHDLSNDRVVWGDEHWMFLRKAIRYSCHSPRLVAHAVSGIRIFAKYLRGLGKDVAFMIAPNKSTIYPDKVAHRFKKYLECENRHRRTFHAMLSRFPKIKYLDAFAPTRAARKRWPMGVYHWFEVHWDCRGNAVLGNLMLRDYHGDPSRILPLDYVQEMHVPDISHALGRPFKAEWTTCRSTRKNVKLRRLDDGKDAFFSAYAAHAIGSGSVTKSNVLFIHDSFANHIHKVMPQMFSRFTMYNIHSKDAVKLARAIKAADKIYVEVVERSAYVKFRGLGHPRFMRQLKKAMRTLPR